MLILCIAELLGGVMNVLYESFKISKRGKRMFRYIALNIEIAERCLLGSGIIYKITRRY